MGGFNTRPSHIYRHDPDETDGRGLYRAKADAEASAQLAYERRRVRMKPEGGER